MEIRVNETIEISSGYKPLGLVFMKNGCCEDRAVVITKSTLGGYSCQCSCGGWCSNGHATATAAILEYARMSKGHGIWDKWKIEGDLQSLEEAVNRLKGKL